MQANSLTRCVFEKEHSGLTVEVVSRRPRQRQEDSLVGDGYYPRRRSGEGSYLGYWLLQIDQ